jgi:hypothetical protein
MVAYLTLVTSALKYSMGGHGGQCFKMLYSKKKLGQRKKKCLRIKKKRELEISISTWASVAIVG